MGMVCDRVGRRGRRHGACGAFCRDGDGAHADRAVSLFFG